MISRKIFRLCRFTFDRLLVLVGLLSFVIFREVLAHSDELTIQDSSGFTRAAEDVQGSARVEFNVAGDTGAPASDVEVTLTSSTGEVIRAVANNGIVIFDSVAPGTWTVATNAPGIIFTNVAITGGVVAAGTAGGLALGAAALGVGGGTLAIIAANDDDDEGDEMSPAS